MKKKKLAWLEEFIRHRGSADFYAIRLYQPKDVDWAEIKATIAASPYLEVKEVYEWPGVEKSYVVWKG